MWDNYHVVETEFLGSGRGNQPVLALLPAGAAAIGASAGLVEGPEGGVVFVAGMATFAFGAGDELWVRSSHK